MTAFIPQNAGSTKNTGSQDSPAIVYPSCGGAPFAKTDTHLMAIDAIFTAQLQGDHDDDDRDRPTTDSRRQILGLRLQVEGTFLTFYREDNGEKLLTSNELAAIQIELAQQNHQRTQEKRRAAADRLRQKRRSLGIDPETLE
ncbi:hypothetical protein IQ266_15275 [filamentous cyanobacterium LEGE 11480]|uniref:Uncharacterized protein n=1 Tax=Romeriopsis navalis LEGE 11480 TaxID=2777977 RepID=A0A928VML2_9CYAN|nr:hypothetical protein [Romeriopsis navalis]MBE9031095.1 hypothetical protein [Romeriopsis navalis LEGE 11480]